MRTLLLFAFLFSSTYAAAQLIVTDRVINDFKTALQKCNAKPIMIDKINSFGYGLMIISVDKTDTLNKKDFKRFDDVQSYAYESDTDKVTGKITERKLVPLNEDVTNQPMPYGGVSMHGKGILINASIMEPFETHIIENGKLTDTYEEYAKYDTVFRLKLSDKKTNTLNIPMKRMTLKINSLKFKTEDIVYGEVDFITQPFYVDDSSFKTGYIIKTVRRRYIFRAPVRPEQFAQ